ncbi:MAG: hypothetical protein M3472_04905, partial [Chloroflexota bacterium]|nr:hypothetical protein [Chloroflexota bacterium]
MESLSVRPARRRLTPSSSRTTQQRLAAVVTGIFLTGTLAGALTLTVPPEKVSADAERPRAVIIVGPSSSSTSKYLEEGEAIADQARDAGMEVTRIFHPRATWERVRPALQGANLVVYFG